MIEKTESKSSKRETEQTWKMFIAKEEFLNEKKEKKVLSSFTTQAFYRNKSLLTVGKNTRSSCNQIEKKER